jgi:hypothetical protein
VPVDLAAFQSGQGELGGDGDGGAEGEDEDGEQACARCSWPAAAPSVGSLAASSPTSPCPASPATATLQA